jgi:hypothetical protein
LDGFLQIIYEVIMKLSLLFLLAIVITAHGEAVTGRDPGPQKTDTQILCENDQWRNKGYDSYDSCIYGELKNNPNVGRSYGGGYGPRE